MSDGIFSGLDKLYLLDLSHNRIRNLCHKLFNNLKRLESLILQKNMISYIYPEMFISLPLRGIDLAQNQISSIKPGTFSKIKSLEFLNLEGNCLREIKLHTFRGLSMSIISLDNNNIAYIYKEIFKNLQVQVFSVNNNNFTSVEWISFLTNQSVLLNFKCPKLQVSNCHDTCNKENKRAQIDTKIFRNRRAGEYRFGKCKYCNCECKSLNFSQECGIYSFEILINKFGCGYCKCSCTALDCDSPCGGPGLGVFGEKDMTGCFVTCNGCINQESK